MYPNLSLYQLKVIWNFDKQCFYINFYDFFSVDSKNENIIESLGISKIKTEYIYTAEKYLKGEVEHQEGEVENELHITNTMLVYDAALSSNDSC